MSKMVNEILDIIWSASQLPECHINKISLFILIVNGPSVQISHFDNLYFQKLNFNIIWDEATDLSAIWYLKDSSSAISNNSLKKYMRSSFCGALTPLRSCEKCSLSNFFCLQMPDSSTATQYIQSKMQNDLVVSSLKKCLQRLVRH